MAIMLPDDERDALTLLQTCVLFSATSGLLLGIGLGAM